MGNHFPFRLLGLYTQRYVTMHCIIGVHAFPVRRMRGIYLPYHVITFAELKIFGLIKCHCTKTVYTGYIYGGSFL